MANEIKILILMMFTNKDKKITGLSRKSVIDNNKDIDDTFHA